MNQINQKNDDVDLFDFTKKLWAGKLFISSFVFVFVLIGYIYLSFQTPVYESKLFYSVQTIPPFFKDDNIDNKALSTIKIKSKYQNLFYSKESFDNWKSNNKNSTLKYNDFSPTQVVDGYILTRDEGDRLAKLMNARDTDSYIHVMTNDLSLLNDFYNYADHVGNLLETVYLTRAESEFDSINKRITNMKTEDQLLEEQIEQNKNKSIPDSTMEDLMRLERRKELNLIKSKGILGPTINKLLSLESYIVATNEGADIISFQRPTKPNKISPRSSLLIIISGLLGALISMLIIVIRSSNPSNRI